MIMCSSLDVNDDDNYRCKADSGYYAIKKSNRLNTANEFFSVFSFSLDCNKYACVRNSMLNVNFKQYLHLNFFIDLDTFKKY